MSFTRSAKTAPEPEVYTVGAPASEKDAPPERRRSFSEAMKQDVLAPLGITNDATASDSFRRRSFQTKWSSSGDGKVPPIGSPLIEWVPPGRGFKVNAFWFCFRNDEPEDEAPESFKKQDPAATLQRSRTSTIRQKWATAGVSWSETAKHYPVHFLTEAAVATVALFACSVIVFLYRMREDILIDALPRFNGTLDEYRFEAYESQALTPGEFIIVSIDHPLTFVIGLVGGIVGVLSMMWDRTVIMKVNKKMGPFIILPIGWYILDASIRALTGKAYSKSINILGGALTIGGFVVKYTLVLGRTANSRGLGFLGAAVCGIVILVIAYQRVVLPRIFVASDVVKAIFTVFINPIIMEVPLCFFRCTVRLLSNNEPSTNAFLVGLVIVIKKAFGRFVLATVGDEVILTIASVLLTAAEVLLTASVKYRDVWVYNLILGKEKAKRAALYSKRNRHLRVHTAVIESCSEYVFILIGALIVVLLDISPIGTGPDADKVSPKAGTIAFNTITQIAFEILTDVLNVMVLLRAGLPYMEHAATMPRGWLLKAMVALGAVGVTILLHLALPNTVQRLPGAHPADLIFVY